MVKLGDEVKDTVTGFKGTIIAVSHYLNGCTRMGVQGKCGKDGKLPDAQWIDEEQLIVTKPKTVTTVVPKASRRTGGPVSSVPQRQQDPRL